MEGGKCKGVAVLVSLLFVAGVVVSLSIFWADIPTPTPTSIPVEEGAEVDKRVSTKTKILLKKIEIDSLVWATAQQMGLKSSDEYITGFRAFLRELQGIPPVQDEEGARYEQIVQDCMYSYVAKPQYRPLESFSDAELLVNAKYLSGDLDHEMVRETEYYDGLGVRPSTASESEIKEAYHMKARQVNPVDTQKFQVHEAWLLRWLATHVTLLMLSALVVLLFFFC